MFREKFFSWRNLNLIREFTATDFKIFYKNSLLGYFWSLLNPLLIFGVLYFIFTIFVRFDLPHYQLYLLLGIIIWNFLSMSVQVSLEAILTKGTLLQKVSFPRTTIIISSVFTGFITFLLNMAVFGVFLLFNGVIPDWRVFLFLFCVAELFLLVAGLSLFLSALYVSFRDVGHIWAVVLQVGFWLTPIVYPLGLIPAKYAWLFTLNPMAQIIIASRQLLIYKTNILPGFQPFLTPASIGLTFVSCLAIFLAGVLFYNWRSPYFAEEL